MSFAAPALLAALAAVPIALALLWLLWRRRRFQLLALRRIGGGAIAPHDARRHAGRRALLLAAVLALLAFAAARPQFGADELAVERPPLSIVIALDVSQSMSAQDLQPSRFAAATAELHRLIDAQRTARVGLVIFAGQPFVRFPLTLDHASALAVLDALQPGESLVPPGSNIAAAIRTALDLLQRAEAARGAIVVVSDGETHAGDAAAAAREAAERGVRVFTAGVGTALGTSVPAPGGQANENRIDARTGREVRSRLEAEALRVIAASGGGRYLPIDAPGALGGLSADFAAIDRAGAPEQRAGAPREQFQWFAAAALILLGGGAFLRLGPVPGLAARARRLRAAAALTGVIVFAALWLAACADSGAARHNRDGNAHFAAGRYQQALESWREAQRRAPEEPIIALNAGRALHALGQFERAETATLAAVRSGDPQIRAIALFHTGNHRWAADDLLGARAAFIEALRARPDLLDAKINLELVNRQLAEQAAQIDSEGPAAEAEQAERGGVSDDTGEAGPEGQGSAQASDGGGSSARGDDPAGAGDAQAAGSDGGASADGSQTPSFEERDRVAQDQAADLALSQALEDLPLENATPEQALAVLDALRAAPDHRLGAGSAAAPLEGVDDW